MVGIESKYRDPGRYIPNMFSVQGSHFTLFRFGGTSLLALMWGLSKYPFYNTGRKPCHYLSGYRALANSRVSSRRKHLVIQKTVQKKPRKS